MTEPFTGTISRHHIEQRIAAHPLGEDAHNQRRRFATLVLGTAGAVEANASDEPVAASVVVGDGENNGAPGSVVYFHGGGYAFGSPTTHARIGLALAERTKMRVVMAGYPLAPEYRWPAQLDAAVQAVDDISGPVVLAGDSAGGHLALVTALAMARRGRDIAGLILFSPNTDRSGLSTTRSENDPHDPMVDDQADRALAAQCFGDLADTDPQVSPVLDDLTLLPPTFIEVGGSEVLLGDARILADRANAAGVEVDLHVEPDGLHMGQIWAPWWPVATASLDRAAHFARSAVEDPL